MINRINSEYKFEDNDASASAFGWDFQANAGIYLFLSYVESANSIAIESKYQDIEIALEDKTLYAQAKALQDEHTVGTEKAKFRDAIVSLSKVKIQKDDLLMYISNLKAPIDGEKDKFRNDIVSFNQCDIEQQKYIKGEVETVIAGLIKKNKDSSLSKSKRAKNIELIKRLNSLNYDNIFVSSIYPFCQTADRYKIIKEKTIEILTSKMYIDAYEARGLAEKILTHWQTVMHFNSTISDKGNERKSISKKDFVWTVIATIGEKVNAPFIEKSLSQCIDSSIEEECNQYLQKDDNIYHERFEFMNKVLQAYEVFKHTLSGGQRSDEAFICCAEWKKYCSEFDDIENNLLLKEYVTKRYLYKIINKNKQFNDISKGVKLCK